MGTIQHNGVKAQRVAMAAGCACSRCDQMRETRRYVIGGGTYTLAEMLSANEGDDALAADLAEMLPGDCRHDMHGEDVDCVRVSL